MLISRLRMTELCQRIHVPGLIAAAVFCCSISASSAAPLVNAKDMFYQDLKAPASAPESTANTTAYCLELHRGTAPPVLCNNRYPFRSGDGIRLHVKTSSPRYAYIVLAQGSTGKKQLLYPPPGSSESNLLQPGTECLVPPHGVIKFDNNPGAERLSLILSPQPIDTSRALAFQSAPVDSNSLTGIPQNAGEYSVYSNDGVYNLGDKASGNGLVFVHNPNPGTATAIGIVLNHGGPGAGSGSSTGSGTSSSGSTSSGSGSGSTTPQRPPANNGPNKPVTDKWAFLVGVNKFANFPDNQLRFCVSDAQYLRDFLVNEAGFKPNHVYFLTDEQATGKNIMRVMTQLLPAAIRRDDLVLLYFSSHGSPKMKGENFIVTHDFQLDTTNGIPMSKLGDIIKSKIPSDRVITILDTCYSGNARYLDSKGTLDDLLVGSGQIIVSSCGPNETSLEDPRIRHGYFTYYLVNAFRNNRLLKQSFDVCKDKVVTQTQAEHNHPQHPVVNYDRWKGNDLPIQVPSSSPRD